MNDIQHKVDIISTEKILQWWAAVQELIHVDFKVGFLLEHLCEIAWVFFRRKIQPTVDAINAHIKSLKKETADLKAHCEHLLSSVTTLDHF